MYEFLFPGALLDLSRSLAGGHLAALVYPWQVLPELKDLIIALMQTLNADEYDKVGDGVFIGKGCKLAPNVAVTGPLILGPGCEVRPGAFIRGSVLAGAGCVIGNSTELKNCILFDGAQAPHFNYVGDSVLGYKAHMGAGAITSNLKSDKSFAQVRVDGDLIGTGLKKFGAILGDRVEVGCNSVLNPGTVIGRDSTVYPLSLVRGYVPPNSIFKHGEGEIIEKRPHA